MGDVGVGEDTACLSPVEPISYPFWVAFPPFVWLFVCFLLNNGIFSFSQINTFWIQFPPNLSFFSVFWNFSNRSCNFGRIVGYCRDLLINEPFLLHVGDVFDQRFCLKYSVTSNLLLNFNISDVMWKFYRLCNFFVAIYC